MVTQTQGSHRAVTVQLPYSCCPVARQLSNSDRAVIWQVQGSHRAVTGSHCAVGGQTTWGCVTATGGAINWVTSNRILQNKILLNLISFHLWKPPLAATRPPCVMFSWHLKTRKRVAQGNHRVVAVQLPCSCCAVTVQSLCGCSAVLWQLLCSCLQSCAVAVQSPCSRFAVAMQSLCSHHAVAMQFLCSH